MNTSAARHCSRIVVNKLFVSIAVLCLLPAFDLQAQAPLIQDRTHNSSVLGETRHFRIFLPPDYGDTVKRYPVIYWFHGWSERYNRPSEGKNYDEGSDYGGDTIGAFVANHDVIVVKADGFNPRTPTDEKYVRPWNVSPVETDRQFAPYFPELVSYIDANYRTIADREHRATTGYSMGGFMSFWLSGKYPDLVASASAFMPSTEFVVGQRGIDAEYRHEEMWPNYEGVRTRLITGSDDFIRFYHRRLKSVWLYTRPNFETVEFESEHGTPEIKETFEFHMKAFADPLTKPAVWSHIDVFPYFSVWGWDVASDRRQPGFTVLENVSKFGFRCAVREWVPSGAILPQTSLSITTAPLYTPGSTQAITQVRPSDGRIMRSTAKADEQGRLTINLDGQEWEVGISNGPVLAMNGHRVESEPWAIPKKPVKVFAKFWNKGASPSPRTNIKWETDNPSTVIQTPAGTIPALAPGASAEVPVTFTVYDETREILQLKAVAGTTNFTLTLPIFGETLAEKKFEIADGRSLPVFQHGTETSELTLGAGNADGTLQPGESFALLLPDGDAYRAAELFTDDPCLDMSIRASDFWADYDHVGASAKYSIPKVKETCETGHVIQAVARIQLPNKPNHRIRQSRIELRVEGKPEAPSGTGRSGSPWLANVPN